MWVELARSGPELQDCVLVDRVDRVMIITMNRPQAKKAINREV